MSIDWQATYLQAGREVLGAMHEQDRALLVGVPFFDWPSTVLAAIDARANELTEQAHDPPLDVVEEWSRHCQCCMDCWEYPCAACCAGGVCDAMPCRCDEESSDWNDGDDDIPGMDPTDL
jgi:hypothetical protein